MNISHPPALESVLPEHPLKWGCHHVCGLRDLFTFMADLALIDDQEKVLSCFVEYLNRKWPGDFKILSEARPAGPFSIRIASLQSDFGYLQAADEEFVFSPNQQALLKNAVGMLSAILGKNRQAKILVDEKARLEAAVTERTKEHLAANEELKEQIAESQRTENLLRESERKYRFLADQMSDIIWIVDRDLRTTYVSPSIKKVLGFTPEERMTQEVHTQMTPASMSVIRSAMATELMHEQEGQTDPKRAITLELEFHHRDGSTRWLESVVSIIRDDQGTLSGFHGVSRDVTERKKMVEALREQDGKFRTLLETMDEGYFETDLRGRFTFLNDSFARMYGKPQEAMVGTRALGYMNPETGRRVENYFIEVYNGARKSDLLEIELLLGDGKKHYHEFSIYLIHDHQGKPVGFRGIVRDVTERKQEAEALLQKTALLAGLLDSIPDRVFFKDMEGVYLGCNPEFARFVGRSQEEIEGKTDYDFFSKEPADLYRETDRRATKGGKPIRFETWIEYPDGHRILSETMKAPLLSSRGEMVGLVAVGRDITARKKVEEALRKSERQYRQLFESVPIGLFRSTPDGRMLDANAALAKILGQQDRESLMSVNLPDTYADPRDRLQFLNLMEKNGAVSGFRVRRIRRDGTLIWVETHSLAVRNPNGRILYYEGSVQDITDRLKAEEALEKREKEARRLAKENEIMAEIGRIMGSTLNFDEIYEGFAEAVKRIIPFDRIVINAINPEKNAVRNLYVAGEEVKDRKPDKVYALEGSGNAEMVRTGSTLLIQTDDFQEYRDRLPIIWSTFQAGFRSIMNVPLFSKGKIIGGLLLRSRQSRAYTDKDVKLAERIGNQIAGAIANAILFAEQKKAEKEKTRLQEQLQQAQKMEAIGTLAGGIAHDFNNILMAILGYAELAGLDLPRDSKTRENLQNAIRAGHRAKELVKQILAFSRQAREERRPLNIKPIVKEELKFLRASLPATIEIRQEMDEGLWTVEADPTQIHQVLMNLCTNAAHAMGERGGILRVSLDNCTVKEGTPTAPAGVAPGPYLRLRVSDTGQGMPPEILKRIFDPYFTTKEIGKGTGLGLAVVHGIVKGSGGGITVSSEVDKGSTFDVYFPGLDAPKPMPVSAADKSILAGGDERILVVDDEPTVIEVVRGMLTVLSYRISARTNSIEALELFRATPDQFDLVITDMTMPNMTGEKLAAELLKIRPDIPIIMCTGFSEYITKEKAESMRIREFLLKPLVLKDLAQAVRRVLDNNHDKGEGGNGSNPGDR